MHKLNLRSLSVDPAGIILKTCNRTGVIQTVCIKKDPFGKKVFVPFS